MVTWPHVYAVCRTVDTLSLGVCVCVCFGLFCTCVSAGYCIACAAGRPQRVCGHWQFVVLAVFAMAAANFYALGVCVCVCLGCTPSCFRSAMVEGWSEERDREGEGEGERERGRDVFGLYSLLF